MPRSLIGSLLRVFSDSSTSDDQRAAARAARTRALFDAQLLPEAVSSITKDGNHLMNLRVGIVGAGFAGLSAAWYLRTCGVDVTVFEALDRVGGRVHTDHEFIPGKLVEAGAELIGDNHPLWLELAERFGLDLVELTTGSTRMRFGDRELSTDEIEALHDGLLPHLDVIGEEALAIHPVRPWESLDAQRFDAMSVSDKLDELGSDLTPLQRAAIEFTLGNDACASVDVQSYLGLLTLVSAGRTGDDVEGMRGYWQASESTRCVQGNQALADRIAQWLDFAVPGTVRLGTPVNGIAITAGFGFAGATVTTGDGATHEFDHVILAVPAPQWSGIEIEPPLPAGEYEIDHGPAVKYLTVFDDLTWPGSELAPTGMWDQLGSSWESTDRQQPAGPPFGLTVFSGGQYVLPDATAYAGRLATFLPGATPVRATLVDWRATGYSVPTVGQVTTVGQRLSLPHEGHLFFAGEQTSMGFYGYMEGALQSGARAARATMREVLGAALPAASPSGVFLPIGHRDGDAATQRAWSREMARLLTRDPAPFAGDRVDQRYSVAASAPAQMRTVCALWSGTATIGQTVEIVMSVRLRLLLGSLLGEDAPIPVRATYGPVQATVAGTLDVTGGAPLGALVGADFTIRFQDQDDYHLHPLAVFEMFEYLGLWAGTGGLRCPLLPDAPEDVPPMAIAGPVPAPPGAAHLVLSGGSRGWTVHHPPDPLSSTYLSFLSNDPIVVTLGNRPDQETARLTVGDVTEATYQTAAANPIEVDLDAGYTFVAETALRPAPLPYGALVPDSSVPVNQPLKPGRRTPNAPLAYEFVVTLPGGGATLRTIISQDTRDVIRQEYRFHGSPFQAEGPLTVPARAQIERASRPWFAAHFTDVEFATNNYFPVEWRDGRLVALDPRASYLVRGSQMLHVAEYLRMRYTDHIRRLRTTAPDSIPAGVPPGLVPTSAWRNPERNENVGGVRNSNHQWGQAVDLAPAVADKGALRGRLIGCLFAAARDLLEELIERNGVAALGVVEILLENGSSTLWSYRARPDGTILDAKGSAFRSSWGSPPSIAIAVNHATHVHVSWPSKLEETPLELPQLRSDPPPAPPPLELRNIILVASDDSSLPRAERLPINHTAESVRAYLATVDPGTRTDVHVVADPVEWLARLNAFDQPTYRIRYLFSFSHAWPGGLDLKHYPKGTDYETVIHDPTVMTRLGEVYDPRPFDQTSAATLPTGTDDLLTFKTNQIRIANLSFLPEEAKQRLRRTFTDAEGIYIAGCRTAQQEGVPHPPFCAALAALIGKPVRGAAYYSKVFSPDAEGNWHQRDLTRDDPTPADQPVVLVPGGYGRGQLAGYLWAHGLPPSLPPFPHTSSNLLELYDTFLDLCSPEDP
ncbi:MAG: FAD-dependent oxidoreductase [Candidatus Nanopelagicales bacterium]